MYYIKSRQEIKAEAKLALKEQYGVSVGLVVIPTVFAVALSLGQQLISTIGVSMGGGSVAAVVLFSLTMFVVSIVASFITTVVGINVFGEFIKISKGERADIGTIFTELRFNFWRKLGGSWWMALWMMIWLLPSIVIAAVVLVATGSIAAYVVILFLTMLPVSMYKSLQYYFVYNILVDLPEVTATQALRVSITMTREYISDLFVFILSWFGWFALSILTCGLLYIFYVGPYWYVADASLYLELKNKALTDGTLTYEELGMERPREDFGIENDMLQVPPNNPWQDPWNQN